MSLFVTAALWDRRHVKDTPHARVLLRVFFCLFAQQSVASQLVCYVSSRGRQRACREPISLALLDRQEYTTPGRAVALDVRPLLLENKRAFVGLLHTCATGAVYVYCATDSGAMWSATTPPGEPCLLRQRGISHITLWRSLCTVHYYWLQGSTQ